MKIFISGCAGYLGSKITEMFLKDRLNVVGLDNFYYYNQSSILHLLGDKRFEFHKGDIRDKPLVSSLIRECDVILNLAALVGVSVCNKDPEAAKEINEDSVKFIMDSLSKNQRVVFPQTNSGYGIGGKDFCTEEDELHPISLYGVTKCNAEKYVLNHSNSVSLRLATVYGASSRPRFDLMVNYYVSEFYFKNHLTVYEPEFRRNFVHIHDVARAFNFFAFNDLKGIFNVGNDEDNLTKIKLAEFIAEDFYGKDYKNHISIGEGEDTDKRDYEVSSKKIRDSGFRFGRNLSDGIKEVKKMCSLFDEESILNMRN